jgi:hypothetical protein
MKNLATAVLGLALWLGVPAVAERLIVVPSEEANKQAYVTNKGIRWYTSLPEAEAAAKKQGKLVFWLHMLGTIDGAT